MDRIDVKTLGTRARLLDDAPFARIAPATSDEQDDSFGGLPALWPDDVDESRAPIAALDADAFAMPVPATPSEPHDATPDEAIEAPAGAIIGWLRRSLNAMRPGLASHA